MAPRTCLRGHDLEIETIGRKPGIVCGYCPSCDVVYLPDALHDARPLPAPIPISSADRREREDDQGPGAA
jgi:hypothetical protein